MILNPTGPVKFDFFGLRQEHTAGPTAQNAPGIEKLDSVIVRHIRLALSRTNGRIHGKGGAAALRGINPSTLRSRIEKLGIYYDH